MRVVSPFFSVKLETRSSAEKEWGRECWKFGQSRNDGIGLS